MIDIQELTNEGFLPKVLITCTRLPICASCQIGKGTKNKDKKSSKIIKNDIIEPGDLFYMDQAESSTPGRPLNYSGKNSKKKLFYVTLFVDSVSKKVFLEFQHTTTASKTIESKHRVEREAFHSGVKVKRYCADNGIFKARAFRLDLNKLNQEITYCGFGAHHQNGIAERYIRTMVEKARYSMTMPAMISTYQWNYGLLHCAMLPINGLQHPEKT